MTISQEKEFYGGTGLTNVNLMTIYVMLCLQAQMNIRELTTGCRREPLFMPQHQVSSVL
jgi:hypothetical protein